MYNSKVIEKENIIIKAFCKKKKQKNKKTKKKKLKRRNKRINETEWRENSKIADLKLCGTSGKEHRGDVRDMDYRRCKRYGFNPSVGKIPTPVFLSGKSHGQRSLAG